MEMITKKKKTKKKPTDNANYVYLEQLELFNLFSIENTLIS